MKQTLETKNAAIAAIPANSTLVLFAAVVDGSPTAAQIETARNAVGATLEIVGATATSSYLARFEPVELDVDADESLLLTVDATLTKVAPDSETLAAEVDENAEAAETTDEGAAPAAETAVETADFI